MIIVPTELQTTIQKFFSGEPVIWSAETLDMAVSIVQKRVSDTTREEVLGIILELSVPAGRA